MKPLCGKPRNCIPIQAVSRLLIKITVFPSSLRELLYHAVKFSSVQILNFCLDSKSVKVCAGVGVRCSNKSKMGRTLVYPKSQRNTVHRKGDRGKFRIMDHDHMVFRV